MLVENTRVIGLSIVRVDVFGSPIKADWVLSYCCGRGLVAEAEFAVSGEESCEIETFLVGRYAGCGEADAIGCAFARVARVWVKCHGEVKAASVSA